MADEKPLLGVGSSHNDLQAFPKDSRREAGFQLGKVQAGIEPADWKPFDQVGAGTRELRIREAGGIYGPSGASPGIPGVSANPFTIIQLQVIQSTRAPSAHIFLQK